MELRTIFFIDDTSLQSSFYIHELPFHEKFLDLVSEWTPGNTVCILCFREVFSGRRLIVTIGRDREGRDLFISSGTSNFYKWIFRDVSDKDNFVDSSHKIELKIQDAKIQNDGNENLKSYFRLYIS
jgi:hypothetical protein